MDWSFGIANAYIKGMEMKEREKLIEIHKEALRIYLADPKLWSKEIEEKIRMIEELENGRSS